MYGKERRTEEGEDKGGVGGRRTVKDKERRIGGGSEGGRGGLKEGD